MIIEYPKAIYNNTDKMTSTVTSKENHEVVKGYFKDQLDHGCIPYTIIPESEALRIYGDAVKEVKEILDETKVIELPKEEKEPPQEKNLRSLTYLELILYAKQVRKETGVKFPVRATRESIEKSIREALNEHNDK